jgi:hypothetical protein
VRDQIVDFVRRWSEASEIGAGRFVGWLGVSSSKFYDWRERYGRVNEHNGWGPRDFWLEDWEKQAIVNFHLKNPLEGYRRLTFMMLDADIVAVSPEVLLDGGSFHPALQLFDIRRDLHGLHLGQIRQILLFAPAQEFACGDAVGGAGFFVADVDGEEIQEAPARPLSGTRDQRRKGRGRCRFSQGHKLSHARRAFAW